MSSGSNSFTVTVQDTSPLVKYDPPSDDKTWISWFSNSHLNTNPGEFGDGESWHNSSSVGSSFSLAFNGSSITIVGSANCSYNATLDGNVRSNIPPSSSNVLYTTSGLSDAEHQITLAVASLTGTNSQLAFDYANITFTVPADAPTVSQTRIDNQNKSIISYGPSSGSWSASTVADVPSATEAPFSYTLEPNASAQVTFRGIAAALTGSVTPGHGSYSIFVDGLKYTTLPANSEWLIGDQLLYLISSLDPSTEHTIKIVNAPDSNGAKLALNSFIIWGNVTDAASTSTTSPAPIPSPSTTSPSSSSSSQSTSKTSSHTGAIVGGVIGGLALITTIFLVLFFRQRKRRKQERQRLPEPIDAFTLKSQSSPLTGSATTSRGQEVAAAVPLMSSKKNARVQFLHSLNNPLPPPPPATTHPSASSSVLPATAPSSEQEESAETRVIERLFTLVAERISSARNQEAPPPAYQ